MTNDDRSGACPACGEEAGRAFFRSELAWSIRSDSAPLPTSATAVRCTFCGHVFKEAAVARLWADYQGYEAYGDDPTRDKLDFAGEQPVARSAALVAHLSREGILAPGAAVLDYGCHRGALLATLGPGGHAGFDVSDRYRPIVESLGFQYHTPADPLPEGRFDVLTLVHVAEHLIAPPDDLAAGLRALRTGGWAVIQVPELGSQPTDLYVMDHRSHFTAASLDRTMARAGLSPARATCSILAGELTGVYRKGGAPTVPAHAAPEESRREREILGRGEAVLQDVARHGRPCVVFGAGLMGTLVASVLGGGQVRAVVDDDPKRHGSRLLGADVVPIAAVSPRSALVVVAVPPAAAERVAARCRALGHDVVAPFALPA